MTLSEQKQFLELDIKMKQDEITKLVNEINNIRKKIEKKREYIKKLNAKKRGE